MKARTRALILALALLAGCARAVPDDAAPGEAAPGTIQGAPDAASFGLSASEPAPAAAGHAPPEALNPCQYWDGPLLERQMAGAEARDLPGLRALVVPHYAPELDLLAGVLAGLSPEAFDLVVVVGPDHTGPGAGVTISGRGWDTPYGPLAGSADAALALAGHPTLRARQNDRLLADDHAAAIHMPYLARALPEASVAAVLLSKYTGPDRLAALAETLEALGRQNRMLVIFSVDFSHYQSAEDAARRDAQTVAIMQSGDIAALLGLDSAHMDSPESLAVFLTLAGRWEREPVLVAQRCGLYVENGRELAGTFMLWALADGPQ